MYACVFGRDSLELEGVVRFRMTAYLRARLAA